MIAMFLAWFWYQVYTANRDRTCCISTISTFKVSANFSLYDSLVSMSGSSFVLYSRHLGPMFVLNSATLTALLQIPNQEIFYRTMDDRKSLPSFSSTSTYIIPPKVIHKHASSCSLLFWSKATHN